MQSSTDGMTPTNSNLPDLSDVLAQIDFSAKPIEHGKAGNQGLFHVGKWGSLVIELIAYPDDQEAVLEHYGLSQYQFEDLKANPLFQKLYKDTESTVHALATNGGFQLAARRVAEQGLTVLEEIMVNGDDKERLKAVEMAARLANLDPAVIAKQRQEQATVSTGVQLVVNFGKGLEPPKAFQGQSNTVIDVKPEDIISEVE
nr:MAG TPA: hypothetical protein [Caudoviricetes sp.]